MSSKESTAFDSGTLLPPNRSAILTWPSVSRMVTCPTCRALIPMSLTAFPKSPQPGTALKKGLSTNSETQHGDRILRRITEIAKLLTSGCLDDSRRSDKRVSWTQSKSEAIVAQHICQECNIFYRQVLNRYDG